MKMAEMAVGIVMKNIPSRQNAARYKEKKVKLSEKKKAVGIVMKNLPSRQNTALL